MLKQKLKIENSKNFTSNANIFSHLNKYGWVNLKNILSKEEVIELEFEINSISKKMSGYNFQTAVKKYYIKDKKKLYEICSNVEKTIANMRLLDKFTKIYKKITNKNEKFINLGQFILPGPPNDKRLVYNFHQEDSYYPKYKRTIHFHFPIFNSATIKNGAMSALSKSHKLGRIKDNNYNKIKKGFLSIVPRKINSLVKKYDHTCFHLDKRDLLIFYGELIHKSNSNLSKKCRVIGIHRFGQL